MSTLTDKAHAAHTPEQQESRTDYVALFAKRLSEVLETPVRVTNRQIRTEVTGPTARLEVDGLTFDVETSMAKQGDRRTLVEQIDVSVVLPAQARQPDGSPYRNLDGERYRIDSLADLGRVLASHPEA